MNKYIIKCILYIIGVFLFAFLAIVIATTLEELGRTWISTVILAAYIASTIHIITSMIFDEHRNPKSYLSLSKTAIGIIFIISTLSQIICIAISIVEAYKKFGDIHPIEYFVAAVFILIGAYAYKKATYKLINKEKKK